MHASVGPSGRESKQEEIAMKLHKIFSLAALALAGLTVVGAPACAGQDYPSQPLRLIVPFPPGGGTDSTARFLASALSEKYSWNVVVENRPGAGGTVGLGTLARSAPDGYTLAVGQTSNLSINPFLYKSISYDVAKDFRPVTSVEAQPMVLLTNASKGFKSVADLIEFGRKNPGKLTVGNAGTGTVGDITGRFFAQEAKIDVLHVPYKGAAPAMSDLLGGRVDLYFASSPAAISQLKNDKIKMLAVATQEPVAQLPGVPLLKDTLPGFEAASKTGILVPAGTPDAIVAKLNENINSVLHSPEMISKLQGTGSVVMGGSADDFANQIAKDSAKWSAIIKAADIHLD